MVSMSPYVVGRPAVQSCLFSWRMPRSLATYLSFCEVMHGSSKFAVQRHFEGMYD